MGAPGEIALAATVFGLSGLVLNVALSTLLVNGSMAQSIVAYRVSLQISALHGFLMSVCWLVAMVSHVFVDGLYINAIFGPVLHILPRPMVDAVYFGGLLLNTGWWQLTPAPCIMQYLHLFNGLHKRGRAMSTLESLASSYAFSILLMSFTAIWAVDMLPTPEFEETMITAVRSAYNLTEHDQFLVYGLSVEKDPLNNGRSLKDIAFIAFLPTYAAAYSAFFIVIHRSRRLLRGLTPLISSKTAILQRRFIQLQIVQGLVPLMIQLAPFTFFFISLTFNLESGDYSLIQTLCYYALPTVQGVIFLVFVYYAPRRRARRSETMENLRVPVQRLPVPIAAARTKTTSEHFV